jgi:peptidoglycan/LPS O-acetylase OafA/YrhL
VRYRVDVDGLRAIAVLSVLFFHVGAPFAAGGFVGVDIFFVISGFVITGRVLADIGKDRFSIVDFYRRRIRRIFPALAVTLVACVPVFYVLMLPDDRTEFLQSLVAAIFSVSNIYFWKTSGYFDPAGSIRPLLHTWSLAVEEQFYLFAPIFFGIVLRQSRWLVSGILILVAISSLALSVVLTFRAPSANFFLLPTRAWELLLGALVAVFGAQAVAHSLLGKTACWAGLGLIAAAIAAYTPETPFPGLAALPPTLGAALIIAYGGAEETWTSRLLSSWPMVTIGQISYSLYLVHWPIIVAARFWLLSEPGFIAATVICAVSLLLAALSYKYIENPIRYSSSPWLSGRALFAAATATAGIVGLIGYAGAAIAKRQSGSAVMEAKSTAVENSVGWEPHCFLQNRPYTDWNAAACLRISGHPQTALLWGDSFAAHYVAGLAQLAGSAKVNLLQYTAAGCPPVFGYTSLAIRHCQDFNDNMLNVVAQHDVKIVIMSARWDLLRGRGLEGIKPTLEKLRKMQLEVYVLGASPIFPFRPEYLARRRVKADGTAEASWQIGSEQSERNALLRAHVGTDATFIDPLPVLCPEHKCVYLSRGKYLFADYGHFSADGSKFAAGKYFPYFHD